MRSDKPNVVVTGAAGFIGQNLVVRLNELGWTPRVIMRDTPCDEARQALAESNIIVHLAGVNRSADPAEFMRSNRDFTAWVADGIAASRKQPLVVVSSTTGVGEASEYGRSKLAGEAIMLDLAARGAATVSIYRLPNIFGKWARPNYNSAVATFCHNLARDLPIRIDDPEAPLSLLYVDDLIDQWIELMRHPPRGSGVVEPTRVHHTSVGIVAGQLRAFAEGRRLGQVEEVGNGLARALYATFIAALPEGSFAYPLEPHIDERGSFTEMLKTRASGQFSCLTAHPGVTRGGHYHHSKVEKFLVVHGEARFRFRHILSGATHELSTSSDRPMVIETVPGWAHDVTNIGDELLVALVWANEQFDPDRPDTVAMPV